MQQVTPENGLSSPKPSRHSYPSCCVAALGGGGGEAKTFHTKVTNCYVIVDWSAHPQRKYGKGHQDHMLSTCHIIQGESCVYLVSICLWSKPLEHWAEVRC